MSYELLLSMGCLSNGLSSSLLLSYCMSEYEYSAYNVHIPMARMEHDSTIKTNDTLLLIFSVSRKWVYSALVP